MSCTVCCACMLHIRMKHNLLNGIAFGSYYLHISAPVLAFMLFMRIVAMIGKGWIVLSALCCLSIVDSTLV